MQKILVITCRNIITTCGELRLIKNRAAALKNIFGIKTDFIAYRIRKPAADKLEKLNGPLKVFRNPLDRKRLMHLTEELVSSGKYNCVILSGALVYFLIPLIKRCPHKCRIILDMHGSSEEYREFRNRGPLMQGVMEALYVYTKITDKKYIPQADGFFSVSHALADSVLKDTGLNTLETFIVPCSVDKNISLEEYLKNRKRYREKYKIKEKDVVFVYSGGNSPWQCVEESLHLFRRIKEKYNGTCRMLLFSGSQQLLKKFENDKDIITDSIEPDKVLETLCAGDFGIMLRSDFVTNNVAFPNKFLEYILSGLRVIATPYVYDVRDYIVKYDMGSIVDLNDKGEDIVDLLNREYDMEAHFLRRDMLLKQCGFEETLKPFVAYIRGKSTGE